MTATMCTMLQVWRAGMLCRAVLGAMCMFLAFANAGVSCCQDGADVGMRGCPSFWGLRGYYWVTCRHVYCLAIFMLWVALLADRGVCLTRNLLLALWVSTPDTLLLLDCKQLTAQQSWSVDCCTRAAYYTLWADLTGLD